MERREHEVAGERRFDGGLERRRVAIHELVTMNEEMRTLIMKHAPESKLIQAAVKNGTVTLREECLSRVIEGETTLEEVVRLTQERT